MDKWILNPDGSIPDSMPSELDINNLDLENRLSYMPYEGKEVWGYKIATCIMLVSMVSTYLVAYSSIIKLFLDRGTFEPAVIKQNTYLVVMIKLCFLSFFGAFTMIIVEFMSTLMAITMLLAIFTSGMEGYDRVKTRYLWVFENVFMIDEERTEGLK
jgi:hypothetical protein